MSYRRDSQRRQVYRAEDAILSQVSDVFESDRELRSFVQEVLTDAWTQENFPGMKTEVTIVPQRQTKACARRHWGVWDIRFPAANYRSYGDRKLRQRIIVLHELAHVATDYWSPDGESLPNYGHHWNFCQCYLMLVKKFMGSREASLLEQSFKSYRVRYNKPRVRAARVEMNHDQLVTAQKRMEKARFVRAQKSRILGHCKTNGYQAVFYLYERIANDAHPLSKKYTAEEREWLVYVLDKHIKPEVERRVR